MMLKFTFGISKEEAYSEQGTYFLFEKYQKLKTKLEEILCLKELYIHINLIVGKCRWRLLFL